MELFMALNIPRSAGKYMAFGGMGMTVLGGGELLHLLRNRQRTWAELVDWARQERRQAVLVGGLCIAGGVIIAGALLWSIIGVMQTGSRMAIRPGPIGAGIAVGGVLMLLGVMLIKVAISGNSSSH